MKLLITGLPGSGKTRLVKSCIPLVANPFWIVADEMLGEQGQRVGFKATALNGNSAVIAHSSTIASNYTVGNYAVAIEAIDDIYTKNIKNALNNNQFLIIDEIGRMQILSEDFINVIRQVINGESECLASINYQQEWTQEFTQNPDVLVVVIRADNRKLIGNAVHAMVNSRLTFKKLAPAVQAYVMKLTRSYLDQEELIQLSKLHNYALRYYALGRVSQAYAGGYLVEGDHGDHSVQPAGSSFSCDCDLFMGIGAYSKAELCSHVQAVMLYNGPSKS